MDAGFALERSLVVGYLASQLRQNVIYLFFYVALDSHHIMMPRCMKLETHQNRHVIAEIAEVIFAVWHADETYVSTRPAFAFASDDGVHYALVIEKPFEGIFGG